MKIFISYQFSSYEQNDLHSRVDMLTSYFKDINIQTFVFFRDVENWGELIVEYHEIIQRAFSEIDTCDHLFCIHEFDKISEGIFLEIGYAKAKNKIITIAQKADTKLKYSQHIATYHFIYDDFKEIFNDLDNVYKKDMK